MSQDSLGAIIGVAVFYFINEIRKEYIRWRTAKRDKEEKAKLEREKKEYQQHIESLRLKAIEEKKHPKVDFTLVNDAKIYAFIWPLLFRYRAMRVYITHFHNGTTTYSGQPLLKMTVIQEAIGDEVVRSIKPTHENITIDEWLHRIFLHVKDHGSFYVDNRDRVMIENLRLYKFMRLYAVKSLFYVRITDPNTNETVAIMNMHFPHFEALNDEDREEILERKKKLETIFQTIFKYAHHNPHRSDEDQKNQFS